MFLLWLKQLKLSKVKDTAKESGLGINTGLARSGQKLDNKDPKMVSLCPQTKGIYLTGLKIRVNILKKNTQTNVSVMWELVL